MKFFHLSDLHIGLRLYNRDLLQDQSYIFREIVKLAKEEKPDALVIAGDIYDKAIPSAEAVGVFDQFVLTLKKELPDMVIMMISGNHDSAPRVNIYRDILKEQKIHMIGIPPQTPEEWIQKVTLEDEWGKVNFYLLPFVKPTTVKQIVGTDENGNLLSYAETLKSLIERERLCREERNVMVSHQFYLPTGTDAEKVERMDSEIRTVGNIDQVSSEVLEAFDYSALGHIHKPMKVGSDRIRYCGTPLAVSVSEADQRKSVLCVEIKEKGTCEIKELHLHPLHNVRVLKGTLDEILQESCEDYVSVVLTDKVDLDVLDMQERLYAAFPNLLEIRRENIRKTDYEKAEAQMEMDLDPFHLCCAFLKDLEESEKELLLNVINEVKEEQA